MTATILPFSGRHRDPVALLSPEAQAIWRDGWRQRRALRDRLGPVLAPQGEGLEEWVRRVAGHELFIGASVYDIAALLEVDHELVAHALGLDRLYQRAVDARDRVGFEGSAIEFIDRAITFIEHNAEATL